MHNMGGLNEFIRDFFKRKGGYVFFSVGTSKLLNFLTSVYVVRLLSTSEYGLVVFAITVMSFIIPFVGVGMAQSLVRYGAQLQTVEEKKKLFAFTLKRGMLFSVIIALLIMLLSPWITASLPLSRPYLAVLSFQMVSLFMYEMTRIYPRIINRNKTFSMIAISNFGSIFVVGITLSYFMGAMGYAIALVVVPFVVSSYWMVRMKVFSVKKTMYTLTEPFKTYFSYGFFASLGNVASQLLYAVDILVITYLIHDAAQIAQYKAASIIPFSLLFLPIAVITTDFVKLAKEHQNRTYLIRYYKRFAVMFLVISSVLSGIIYVFADYIMLIFGEEYVEKSNLLGIFAIGIIGGMTFRVPLGNLLSAIGWTKTNAVFSTVILLLNLVLNYYAVEKIGVEGAAWVTSALMWFSGILSLIAFWVYTSRLKKN